MFNISQLQKVSFAFFIAAIFACQTGWGQTITQQSNCFTISITTTDNLSCDENDCDPPPNEGQCTYCYEVIITNNKCPGVNLSLFTMTTPGDENYDCRSVCSPTNDFYIYSDEESPFTRCSWAGPRYLQYTGNSGNPMPYLGTAKFIICRKLPLGSGGGLTYTFDCGCTCGVPPAPCSPAKILF